MSLFQSRSLNFGERAGAARPSMIVLHYTGMKSAAEALERLCDPAAQVSAHYVVEENGRVHNLVKDGKRAWHAGQSCWAGERDINSHSIGIELVNPGHEFGYRPFPEKQIQKTIRLCRKLIKKYNIPVHKILAHSDIAPARKEDPGELFPWPQLAAAGVGVWPAPQDMDFEAALDMLDGNIFFELLCSYGYDSEAPPEAVTRAFHRHFYPEKFIEGAGPEQPDSLSAARLLALIRAKNL